MRQNRSEQQNRHNLHFKVINITKTILQVAVVYTGNRRHPRCGILAQLL